MYESIIFSGYFFHIVVMKMYYHIVLYSVFSSPTSSVSCIFFLSLIIVFPHDCHKSIPKSEKYWRKNRDNYNLWQLPAKLDPSLDSLILFWKNLQKPISCINSRSFLPSHLIVIKVTNREQYDKEAVWI